MRSTYVAAMAGQCGGAMTRFRPDMFLDEFLDPGTKPSPRPYNSASKNHDGDVVKIKPSAAAFRRPGLGDGKPTHQEPCTLATSIPVLAFFRDILLQSSLGESRLPSVESQASNVAQLNSQASADDRGLSGGCTSRVLQNNIVVHNLAGRCSSKEVSDSNGNGPKGETGKRENVVFVDERRIRRMIANRESARRSRKRKQDQINILQEQVSQLRLENASLLERLTDITDKYNEVVAKNEILRLDVEAMGAKVKAVTDVNPLSPPMSNMPVHGIPFSPCLLVDEEPVLLEVEASMHFPDAFARDEGVQACVSARGAAPAQEVITNTEHGQKRICRGSGSCGPVPWGASPRNPEVLVTDMQNWAFRGFGIPESKRA